MSPSLSSRHFSLMVVLEMKVILMSHGPSLARNRMRWKWCVVGTQRALQSSKKHHSLSIGSSSTAILYRPGSVWVAGSSSSAMPPILSFRKPVVIINEENISFIFIHNLYLSVRVLRGLLKELKTGLPWRPSSKWQERETSRLRLELSSI